MDKFLRFTLVFLGTYLLLSMFLNPIQNQQKIQEKDDIEITLHESDPTIGNLVQVTLLNTTNEKISLGAGTPPEKLSFEKRKNGEMVRLEIDNSTPETVLEPGIPQTFSYPKQNSEFFNEVGKYTISVHVGEKTFQEDLEVTSAGFWVGAWRTFVWKPVYNLMVVCLNVTGMQLGWAIILLTLIVKLLLFVPTQKGMKSQRKMQKLQPELQRIKARNAGNQQKIAMESMELWKKHGVNPMGAMIPMLLQFPFLIALFYVIKEELKANNDFFLYPLSFFQNIDFSTINTNFLGFMDLLTSPWNAGYEYLLLPVVIAIVQYFAMKLSFARMKKTNEENKKRNKNQPKPKGFMADFQNEFQKMNGVFIYLFPGMIILFSSTMPMGVGIYWLISTLFSIGQQYVVNKEVG